MILINKAAYCVTFQSTKLELSFHNSTLFCLCEKSIFFCKDWYFFIILNSIKSGSYIVLYCFIYGIVLFVRYSYNPFLVWYLLSEQLTYWSRYNRAHSRESNPGSLAPQSSALLSEPPCLYEVVLSQKYKLMVLHWA